MSYEDIFCTAFEKELAELVKTAKLHPLLADAAGGMKKGFVRYRDILSGKATSDAATPLARRLSNHFPNKSEDEIRAGLIKGRMAQWSGDSRHTFSEGGTKLKTRKKDGGWLSSKKEHLDTEDGKDYKRIARANTIRKLTRGATVTAGVTAAIPLAKKLKKRREQQAYYSGY